MEVHEVLVRALKEVNEADVPQELRAVAFGKAVDLVAARAGEPTSQSQQVRREPAGDGQAAAGASPLARIAARLKLDDIESVQDIFDHDGQGLAIIISPKKLEKGIGPATKQLALLVAAGRQAAGEDADWTSFENIRRVCEDYKKFDSNFAAHIKAMKNEFSLRGSGQKREVKLTRQGWEAARELVERLAGGEGDR